MPKLLRRAVHRPRRGDGEEEVEVPWSEDDEHERRREEEAGAESGALDEGQGLVVGVSRAVQGAGL